MQKNKYITDKGNKNNHFWEGRGIFLVVQFLFDNILGYLEAY